MSTTNARKHVALVFRHGDRTPIFNAHEPLGLESTMEAACWALSLTTQTFDDNLRARFPVDTNPAGGGKEGTRDKANLGKTFGCLTMLGALQMRRLGRAIGAEYPGITPRRIWSSNFTRTQFSMQCLLAGLAPLSNRPVHAGSEILNVWGTDPTLRRLLKSNGAIGMDIASRITPEEEEAKKVFINAIPAFAYQMRPFSWMSALDFVMCREGKTGGGGILRGRPNPAKQQELFAEMLRRSKDNTAATTVPAAAGGDSIPTERFKHALHHVFDCPFADAALLNRLIDRDNSGTIDFQEIKAFFDSMRLPNASGGVTERELAEASRVVESAVCTRFDSILSQPPVRRISCGGVAKTILQGMDEADAAARSTEATGLGSDTTTIDLYSAHDVTLMPLIKHLGIWDGENWPGVSSALLFERTGRDLRVKYWEGVRRGASGLEPHTMILKDVDLAALGERERVDMDTFRAWVNKL